MRGALLAGMYTKARIAGHPIHPMLIAFPVALYVSTVACLFVHIATGDPFWYRVAMWTNIAGVVTAALAAVPGLIDLLGLPRRTRARATGLRHAAFNVLSLVLFAISAVLLYRHAGNSLEPSAGMYGLDVTAPLVLGLLGIGSTTIAGYLGWTMVQTHHVGVKPSEFAVHSPEETDDLDELPEARSWSTTHVEPTTLRH